MPLYNTPPIMEKKIFIAQFKNNLKINISSGSINIKSEGY